MQVNTGSRPPSLGPSRLMRWELNYGRRYGSRDPESATGWQLSSGYGGFYTRTWSNGLMHDMPRYRPSASEDSASFQDQVANLVTNYAAEEHLPPWKPGFWNW